MEEIDESENTTNEDESKFLLSRQDIASAVTEAKNRCIHTEPLWVTTIQMFIPFILAGFGMVAASYFLDIVQYWPVYQNVTEIFVIVPALLGLKGNLEMTLASRLSTHANLGHFINKNNAWTLIIGNVAMVHCQAVVVGFLASVAAGILGSVRTGGMSLKIFVLLCSSSVVTAIIASFVLSIVMIVVILFSRQHNINPDNVATPIAASLGDLTTLACLSWIATIHYNLIENNWYLIVLFLTISLLVAPACGYVAYKNKYTHQVLFNSWIPVITAMIISSVGGLILDITISQFNGIAIFQLIINGVGGNLAAIQASRMSTELHHTTKIGITPNAMHVCLTPWETFFDQTKTSHGRIAKVLLLMSVPGHLVFLCTVGYLEAGQTSLTPIFVSVYCTLGFIQVFLLLYFAQIITLFSWKCGMDPDNTVIPYLTAFGDLLGTLLLSIGFQFLFVIGDRDSDVGD